MDVGPAAVEHPELRPGELIVHRAESGVVA